MSDKINLSSLIDTIRTVCDTLTDTADYLEEKEYETAKEMLAYIPEEMKIVKKYMSGELEVEDDLK